MSMPSRLSKLEEAADGRELSPVEGDEVGHYLRVLWKWRARLVLVALLAGAAAAGWALLQDRTYEATLSLGVSASKMSDTVDEFTTANFRPLVASHGVAASVIQSLGLRQGDGPMSTEVFLGRVLSVEEIRGTSLLTIRTRLGDPALAAQAANTVAERAVELARRLSRDEAVQVRDEIKGQLDESRQRLDAGRTALSTYRREAQIELVRKDVDAMLAERAGLLKLLVEIGMDRARLERAEQELAKAVPVNTLLRTVDSEPALAEAVRQGAQAAVPLGLEMRYQETNFVHQRLTENVATLRTRLAGLERQRAELIDTRKLDRQQQAKLTELYEKESRLAQLELEVTLAERVFTDVATKFENARLQVAARSAQLVVVDPAAVPTSPLSRGVVRNGVLAFVLALGAGVVAVLLADAVRHAVSNG